MKDKLDSLDLKEIIGYSIESEEKSKQYYSKFVELGKGELVPERFKSLMDDEELHKEALLKLHQKIYGDRDYIVPENGDLPRHEDFENLEDVANLIDALEKAINNEYNAIRIYEYLAEEYEEHSSFFKYIAMMEQGHYESLKKEKDLYGRDTQGNEKEGLSDGIWKRLGLQKI